MYSIVIMVVLIGLGLKTLRIYFKEKNEKRPRFIYKVLHFLCSIITYLLPVIASYGSLFAR